MKSCDVNGEIKRRDRNEELLSLAIKKARNIVIKEIPNIVIPGVILTGLNTSIEAFLAILENIIIKNAGISIPKIDDNGSRSISF